MELGGKVGIGAGALGDHQIIQVDMLLNGARGTDADDILHAVAVEQLVGVNADGGHTHAGGHDGDLDTLVGAGVALHAPDVVDEDGVFQEILGDEFAAQRVAGHQYGLAEITGLCGNVRGGGCKHSSHPFVSVIL